MPALAFEANDWQGNLIHLRQYSGKVILVVNTASQCGFTSQYQGLEQLYQQFREQGVVVLAFPCNQFAQQEPGSENEIVNFCTRNYNVSFPVFEKVKVNGKDAHPFFQYLKTAAPGVFGSRLIKWNFTKFLIGMDGRVSKRYAPQTSPAHIMKDIQKLLSS